MLSGRMVWRITSVRYADQAFDGEGARRYGGRWNRPGIAVAYCSMTLSLAALEFFVHLEPSLAPKGLICVAAEIPGDVSTEEIDPKDLPGDWRSYPAPERLLDLGTDWARSLRTAVLIVPSSVIPHERNVLLNPVHPEAQKLRIRPSEPFS
ncbi:MAG TPA: RES domain-containing protein, partial [Thermoanaerobaculia bacterium]